MRNQFIHKGQRIYKNGRWLMLDDPAYIFNCPDCEYVMTYHTKENAVSGRDLHFLTAHPELHKKTVQSEAQKRSEEFFSELKTKTLGG